MRQGRIEVQKKTIIKYGPPLGVKILTMKSAVFATHDVLEPWKAWAAADGKMTSE